MPHKLALQNSSHNEIEMGLEPAIHETNKEVHASSLVSRNVIVLGHRTSMRLEPAMWDALVEICHREKLSIHQLCDMVAEKKPDTTSFTAAMRVFTMSYFRNACTEEGHTKAGHGSAFVFTQNDFNSLKSTGMPSGVSRKLSAAVHTASLNLRGHY